jgi:hypothetical protein
VGTGIALLAVWIGLVIAVMFNLPPSFCIVTLAFLAWAVARLRDRSATTDRTIVVDHHHHEQVDRRL